MFVFTLILLFIVKLKFPKRKSKTYLKLIQDIFGVIYLLLPTCVNMIQIKTHVLRANDLEARANMISLQFIPVYFKIITKVGTYLLTKLS